MSENHGIPECGVSNDPLSKMTRRSMTGHAQSEGRHGAFRIAWRMTSVNHRFLDLSFRLPEGCEGLERPAAKRLEAIFSRGRLDCALRVMGEAGERSGLELDTVLLAELLRLEEQVACQTGEEGRGRISLDRLLGWPGVLRERKPPGDPDTGEGPFTRTALALLDETARRLDAVRADEGRALDAVLGRLSASFQDLLARVTVRLPEVRNGLEKRLRDRVREMTQGSIDAGRMAQEVAFLLNRIDITEEMDRMEIHLRDMELARTKEGPQGRRLEFLCQELNREANTLCAKAQDGEIARLGVEMKVVVEKMREHVQNLE